MSEKTSILSYGNIKHKPVVFIHGFPFDNHMWKNQIELLSTQFYCVAYDIRGLGSTSSVQFTIEDLVDDLEEIIIQSGVERPFLCGFSMGGYIALRAVERNEENYSGLILCNTKSEADENDAKIKRANAIKKIGKSGVQKYAEEFMTSLFTPESIERLGEEFISIVGRGMNSDPVGVKACLLAMAARTDTTGYLEKIKIPVLVIAGEKDILIPPEQMKRLADKIKNSWFYMIKGIGHVSPVEAPQVVNEKILKFLSENAG